MNTGYDFTGHPLKARIMHSDPTVGDMTERYTYTYDAWGRPLMVTHRLDALSPVVLHDYVYDAVVAASVAVSTVASVAKPSFHGYSMSFRA